MLDLLLNWAVTASAAFVAVLSAIAVVRTYDRRFASALAGNMVLDSQTSAVLPATPPDVQMVLLRQGGQPLYAWKEFGEYLYGLQLPPQHSTDPDPGRFLACDVQMPDGFWVGVKPYHAYVKELDHFGLTYTVAVYDLQAEIADIAA